MARVHEVATGLRPRFTPMPPILPHELTLLLPVRLPEEAGDLVVAGPDAVQQVLHPGGGVSDPELLLDPGPHLIGVVEAPLGDLLLESLDLSGSQPTGIASIVQGTQLVQAFVAGDAEPVPDLAAGD